MRGGEAIATATASGGNGGGPDGVNGAANANSLAMTTRGAEAQALSTATGASGKAQSTAQTNLGSLRLVQTQATGQVGSTATTNAIAQAGGSGQSFINPGQTAYALAVGLPDKGYVTTLVGDASNVTDAFQAPGDRVFGAVILGGNYASDGGGLSHTYSATSTFDLTAFRGNLVLGLIDNQQNGFGNGLGANPVDRFLR
jgi:hypothetical protein